MTYVLVGLGALSLAYGILMAVLYPAGGFFLAWLVLGAALVGAGLVERARLVVCGICLVALLAVGGLSALIVSTAATAPPSGLDCLVVLGAGLRPDGTPTETLRYRLDAALDYLADNPDTACIVSGGQGFGESYTEADSMAAYLVGEGLDASRITKEELSTTTAENIRNSAGLLAPGASVAVVTNDFHLYRALRIAHENGLPEAYGLAARTNPLYLPQATLRECFAVAKDTLVGNI